LTDVSEESKKREKGATGRAEEDTVILKKSPRRGEKDREKNKGKQSTSKHGLAVSKKKKKGGKEGLCWGASFKFLL